MEKSEIVKKELPLSPEGKKILTIYQAARNATKKDKQEKLLSKFCLELVSAIDARKLTHFEVQEGPKNLSKVLIDGRGTDGTLYFDTGSSGDRIFFEKWIIEGHKGFKSHDGKVKWMRYPSSTCAYDWQKKANKRFIHLFGGETVDLMQDLR